MMLAAHQTLSEAHLLPGNIRAVQEFPVGSRIRLTSISGERELGKRLESMGLHAGKTVTLLKNNGPAVLLKVANTRIAFRICQKLTIYGELLPAEV